MSRFGLPAAVAYALYAFATRLHPHYPFRNWLFPRFAGYWALSLLFAAGCLSSGYAVLRALLAARSNGASLTLSERLPLAFAIGVYLFFAAMFVAGLLGLYGTVVFVLLPIGLIASGARPLYRAISQFVRHARVARRLDRRVPSWGSGIVFAGALAIVLVYLPILTPENAAFDSRWQHLAIAEHYAAAGAMRRFPEGWYVGASPHLASLLYTWAFLLPHGSLFDHVELAAHIEFVVFLFTLAGIPALVRVLVPRRMLRRSRAFVRYAWVARFLFPGVFLYDSSLCLGADHVAAIFAVPIYLLVLKAWRDLAPRLTVILALMLSGALLTKYTGALILILAPPLAIALRAVWMAVQTIRGRSRPEWRRNWYSGPLAAVAAGIVFTAPHWLKNLLWYGDPFYPLLHARLHLRPWTPDSADRFEYGFIKGQLWRPERNWSGIKETLKTLLTFSFEPNDWPKFHGKVPVFGSLFTLSLASLPFLRGTRRLWGLFVAVHIGIFAWYWTHHQDRYLQAIVPWMAAATAGTLLLAWERDLLTRILVGALVGLQIVWGGDVYFIPGHAILGSPLKAVAELLSSGYQRKYDERFRVFSPFSTIAKSLSKRAKVLVHNMHLHAGIGVPTVNDAPVNQGGISYGRLTSPRAVFDLLSTYEVTHLLWPATRGADNDTLAGDLVFFNFVTHYAVGSRSYSGLVLAAMPTSPPPDETAPDPIAILGCRGGFASGLYHLADVHVAVFGPKARFFPRPFRRADGDDAALVAQANAVAVETHCIASMPQSAQPSFTKVASRRYYDLWLRTLPGDSKSTDGPGGPAFRPARDGSRELFDAVVEDPNGSTQ